MKAKINLYYNNKYKWIHDNNFYVIGYIYHKNKLYCGNNFLSLLHDVSFLTNYNKLIKEFDGCFSIIIKEKNSVKIISDFFRCFPVFYEKNGEDVSIFDNINEFKNKTLNSLNINELFSCNYVTSDETIYNDIYQVEGHQIVEINDNTINKSYYYDFSQHFNNNDNPLFEKLDEVYDNCVKKAIQYANGRKIVIPLSGGNDSRLLAYYVKQNGYTNVLCYTYGDNRNNESEISKKIADYLGFQWIFVNYKNKSMQNKYYDSNTYKNMVDYCSRGFSSPLIQEWEAIDWLRKNNIIDNECVIMPGFTNDVLCGSHIYDDFFSKEEYNVQDLVNLIKKYHYIRNILPNTDLNNKICKALDIKDENYIFSQDELVEMIEKFDFHERQVKYITNAIRIYDMNNLSWVLPFWNKDVINFWFGVKIEKRVNISFFNEFTNYKYREMMEIAPIYKKEKQKNNLFKKIFKIFTSYRSSSMNLYGYFHYFDYLKKVIKYRNKSNYNAFFASDYIKYVMKKNK